MLLALPILAAATVIALLAIAAWELLQVGLQTVVRHRGPVRRVAVPLLLLGLLLPTVAQASPAPLPLRWRSSAAASGEGEISSGRASREGSSFGENRTSGFRLFLQVDPSGYVDSPNLYAGFANDPVNHRDPTGRDSKVTWSGEDLLIETTLITVPGSENVSQADLLDNFNSLIKKDIEGSWSVNARCNGREIRVAVKLTFVSLENRKQAEVIRARLEATTGIRPDIVEVTEVEATRAHAGPLGAVVTIGSHEQRTNAHEYGHLIGLNDDYFEAAEKAQSKRVATHEIGEAHRGHIMGAGGIARMVASHEICDLIENNRITPGKPGKASARNIPKSHRSRQLAKPRPTKAE